MMKTFLEMKKKAKGSDVDVVNFNYARIVFNDDEIEISPDIVDKVIEKINGSSEKLRENIGVKIVAKKSGNKENIVLIENIGDATDKDPLIFENLLKIKDKVLDSILEDDDDDDNTEVVPLSISKQRKDKKIDDEIDDEIDAGDDDEIDAGDDELNGTEEDEKIEPVIPKKKREKTENIDDNDKGEVKEQPSEIEEIIIEHAKTEITFNMNDENDMNPLMKKILDVSDASVEDVKKLVRKIAKENDDLVLEDGDVLYYDG